MDVAVGFGDYQSVAQLKFIRDEIRQTQPKFRKILITIGLLASSGINSHHVVSIVSMLLRKILPIDIAGFFWSNADGDMVDAYVETPYFLSADTFVSCLNYISKDKANWPTFKDNMSQGSSVGYLLNFQNENFYNSEFYQVTFKPVNMHHIVDITVHDGIRPFGSFILMRSFEKGKFTKDEIKILEIVNKLLISAFKTPIQNDIPTKRTYDIGLLVVDKNLERKFCNISAHQILWMMTRKYERPLQFDSYDHIDNLINKSCLNGIQQALLNSSYMETRECHWGEFLIKYQYDKELDSVAINLQQMQPFPCHLAIKLSQENLTPTRLMITWFLLKGCVRKEISRKLNIAQYTVAKHIQEIFNYFEVSSTNDLILKIYR